MAEIKVSQLPEATQINDEDLLMIVQGNANKKITKANAKFASGDEIYVGDTEPTGEDDDSVKIWVEPSEDSVESEGTYISNSYGVSTEIGYSENYINNHFEGTLLWTNPSPTSATNNDTITLSSDDYDMLEIIYSMTNDTDMLMSSKTLKGCDCVLNGGVYGGNGKAVYFRTISRTDDTHYNTNECNGVGKSSDFTQNAYLIPRYIIGYKTNLFN